MGIKLRVDTFPTPFTDGKSGGKGKLPEVIQLKSGRGLTSALSNPVPALEVKLQDLGSRRRHEMRSLFYYRVLANIYGPGDVLCPLGEASWIKPLHFLPSWQELQFRVRWTWIWSSAQHFSVLRQVTELLCSSGSYLQNGDDTSNSSEGGCCKD